MLRNLRLMTVAGITAVSFAAFAGPGSVSTNPTNPGTQPSVTDHSLTPPPTTVIEGHSNRTTFDDPREMTTAEDLRMGNSSKRTTASKNMSGFGLTSGQIRQAQSQLSLNGHSIAVDGVMGPETAKALRQFQKDQGLDQSGVLDGSTLKALNVNGANDRIPASIDDSEEVMDDSERVK